MSRFLPERIAQQFRTIKSEDFPGVLVPLAQANRRSSLQHTTDTLAGGAPPAYNDKDESKRDNADAERASVSSSQVAYDPRTLEGLRAEIEADAAAFGVDSVYDRKSKVINKAIQDMGMGRYQWQLFVLCGFGWFADNTVRFTTLSLFVGLCLGASFWGIASDIVGRRLAFNTTLFIGAVFGTAVGGADSWIAICALYACMGLGIGGNLPVDGALFLEFLPMASGNLLTLLSVWWPVGSLLASLIAWGLIPSFSCSSAEGCMKADNMGWRYFTFTLGGITFLQWIARFVVFQMFESPKFLLSRGRQAEAVAVVHGLAYKNRTTTWLTVDILNDVGGDPEAQGEGAKLSVVDIVKRSLSKFSADRIGPLFGNWKLGLTTGLLWFEWFTIGLAYPLFNAFLPQYLAQSTTGGEPSSTYITYRNYAISTIVGVPGSLIAAYTVDVKYVGRKGTMAIATMLTGVFVCLFTVSSESDFQLAFTCLESMFQNAAYGVLYAYTPEVFPAPNRGSGTGVASFLNRIGGICAPLIGIYASTSNPKSPIYACGALFLAAFLSMLGLPIETRGKQSL
ncbi:hypothetical protein FH972_025209 [Carpinus fangiana]|uniref:Major facilitator superfamily (MFS) profile domain-containing protein n=1 Tax=Carpinus fangiana TaxID=176857 RepID=A0A5N6L0Q8_9ROSI|nr:hypothetical protein FH972_025209 [Carpinus fangiana]